MQWKLSPSRCPSGKTPSRKPPIHVPLPGHIWISNGVLPGCMDGRHIWISNGVLPQHIHMDGVLPGHVDGKPHWISICACHPCTHPGNPHPHAQAKPHPYVCAEAKPHWISICACHPCAQAKPHWISICACHPCAQAKPHPYVPGQIKPHPGQEPILILPLPRGHTHATPAFWPPLSLLPWH